MRKNIIWQVTGILCFLSLPFLLSPRPPGSSDFMFSPPFLRDFTSSLLMVLFFYGNYYWFIPGFYLRKNYLVYGLILILSLVVISYLPSLLTGYLSWPEFAPPPMEFRGPRRPPDDSLVIAIRHNILLFILVVLFSIFLRVREKLYELEKTKNQMELGALKNQVNPHFLFNTLNSLYAMALRDKAISTADNIMKLSGLMRYVVTETNNAFVTLEKELNYINGYIQLQKIRLDKNVKLNYHVEGSSGSLQIAPLILIPFIENAFKHGVNPDEDSQIDIRISTEGSSLKLIVVNKKVSIQNSVHEQSGLGLENTKSRLRLLYPSRHDLFLSNDKKTFRVVLTIDLDDESHSHR